MSLRKIVFVIPKDVHLLDITGPAHVFFEAKQLGASIELLFVSITNESHLKSSAGLHFSQLIYFEDLSLSKNDIIFIPGMDFQRLESEDFSEVNLSFYKWLKNMHINGAIICSVCTGSFLLGASGLLDFKKATTHWKYLEAFKTKFPKVNTQENRLFVYDNTIYTSAGVSSGIDLSLFLIEESYGKKLAIDVAKEVLLYFRRSFEDPQLSVFLKYRNHINQPVHETQDYILENLNNRLTIEEIAAHIHTSARNLSRIFKKTTGITIGLYIKKLRLEHAIALLQEGHKIDYVVSQIGLRSSNQLRNLLKQYKGLLPSDIKDSNLS